jgi:uncharacterized protein involved in outer membrane biogenesis
LFSLQAFTHAGECSLAEADPPSGERRVAATYAERFRVLRESARVRGAQTLTWIKQRFRKGHAGRIAAWTMGGGVAGLFALVAIGGMLDWNAFKGPVARMASGIAGRPISIGGDLDVRVFTFKPAVAVTQLHVGNPRGWDAEEKEMAVVDRAFAEIDLWPTITKGLTLNVLELQGAKLNLIRIEPGRANWSTGKSGKPLNLPAIRRFAVKDGYVDYHDRKRGLRLSADFYSDERAGASDRPFHLVGEGKLNGRTFRLDLTGAPLINVDRAKPYGFRAEIRAGATRVRGEGQLARAFDFGAYRATLRATGADLADLFYLTGLALPNTPPYNLTGVIERHRTGYDLTNVRGIVGDSDLRGALSVEKRNDRPFVTANFRSNSLDWDDLATVLGAPPSTAAGETASADQRAEAARMAANARLFPDAPLDLKRVRSMDAKLTFKAAKIVTKDWPVRAGSLEMTLNRGVMKFTPLSLTLNQGVVAGAVTVDASRNTPDVSMDMRLSNARLERLIGAAMKEPPIEGPVVGRFKLRGQGASVRKAMDTADGTVSFVASRGAVRKSLAELTGINVIEGLGLLWGKDQSTVNLRCAVADFTVKDGVANRRMLIVDTEDVLILGEGTANLGQETLNLRLQGNPKEPRLIRVRAPITIGGRFRAPKIGVDTGSLAGQGLGAALASLLAPLAAILPFVDTRLAEDANCAQLMAQARTAAPQKAEAAKQDRRGG